MRIYCDNHTSTRIDPEVLSTCQDGLSTHWASYIQPGEEGQQQVKEIQKGFKSILSLVGANEDYTPLVVSSVAEANNHVFHHVYHEVIRKTGRNHLITLNSEDASILIPMKHYEALGAHVTCVALGASASLDVQKVIDAITPRTASISLSLAHGLTGVLHSLKELKEVCSLRKIVLHLDLSYCVGKIPIDVQALGADVITFGADLIHGPKSVALLLAKDELALTPFILGGIEQAGLRAGPFDVAQFLGFSKACELASNAQQEMSLETARIRNFFEKELVKSLPEVDVLFKQTRRLPNVSVCCFDRVHSDSLLFALNKRGVSASIGGGPFQKLSLLLENMGYPALQAHSALSFAFSKYTTQEEVRQLVGILMDEVSRLRLYNQHLEGVYET